VAGKKFHSVGAKIALAFALLLPIFVYGLGSDTYDAINRYRTVATIDRQNAAANNLIAGVYEILMERLATNNALQAANPAGADVLKEIAVRRNAAVAKISAAVDDLNAQEFPDKAALVGGLKAAIDKANGYRTKADAAVNQGKAERDADTVKNLFVSLSELSAMSQKVWSAVLSNTSRLDPELARLTNLRLLGWNLRDIAGFERSHVGQAISAKTAIPPEKLAEIGGIRAQIALLWRFTQMNLVPNDHAAINKGIQLAKDGYFGKFQPLAEEMRKVSGEGAAYPMSLAQWVDTTTPQLFTLLEIMYGAGEASEAHTAKLMNAALWSLAIGIGLLILGLCLSAAAVWMTVRNIARPLGDLSQVVGTMGTNDVGIPHADRGDEIGDMARALKIFQGNSAAMERLRKEQAGAQEAQLDRANKLANAITHFESTIGGVVDTVSSASTQLESAAMSLSKNAEETQSLSTTVAAASEEASTNVHTVASAAEQLSSSVSEIAQRVQESSQIASEAVQQAEKTDARIGQLSQAAGRIGDVVNLITAIAQQTNLLALNATIEAARAGEAGRGFAIVAQEVKALAAQTAKATEEISAQIAGMQTATQDSVGAIKEISGTINRISEITAAIAAAAEQQGSATQEISRNVQQAAMGTTEVATHITAVNRGAAETGSASSQVLSSARSLSNESGRLKTEVDKFLATVRAA
jgi:methyl-accepting chemotaxis protein